MLTKRQKEVLDFIKNYTKKESYAPSLEEIQKYFKLASVSTAHFHVERLRETGYLIKEKNQPRAISISKTEKMIQVPILGTISAGQPIEAVEEKEESIAVSQNNLPRSVNTENVYALRVDGDSMIEENINNGDIILVKNQPTANNGDKVVALIDNSEATVKKFYKEKSTIRLEPANKKLEPLIIKQDQREVEIQGVVIDVIKNVKTVSGVVKEKPKPQIKQYKKLPLNKIILNDALKELKKLPNDICDVIIVDPPYNIGKDFGNNRSNKELNEYIDWCKEWTNECIRTLKPTGTMFIYGFSEILAHLSVEIPINKRWLIWHYTNKNVASLNFWQRSHESIICAWKDKPIFNRDNIREPYTEGFLKGAAGKKRAATKGRFSSTGKETVYNAHKNGALPRDVIKIPALAGGAGMSERYFLCKTCKIVYEPKEIKKHREHIIEKHPTQKPFELSRKLIKSCVPKQNGVVLLPFAGTGSECVAAKQLGHSFIGFEINPDYIKIADKMLKDSEQQPSLI